MARSLILSLGKEEFPVSLLKIDREKLYGKIEIEAFDEHGNEATLKVLAADGDTLISKGGTALEPLDMDGSSLDRTDLIAVDNEGKPLETLPSSFDSPNRLKKADIDDYLSLIVKSVYILQPAENMSLSKLKERLDEGTIYSFQFSYREGIGRDDAYIIGNGEDVFMIIGDFATLEYIKLNQAVDLDPTDEQEISGDEIDFDLL